MKCTFCDFISKKSLNHNWKSEYPVIPIHETKYIYSFLSVPDNLGETHLLIIPKKHYEFLEDVPEKVLFELIKEVKYATIILRKKYRACKILLNNGREAEQYVSHAHFHLIPKNTDKQSVWKNLSIKEFREISEELKSKFQ